MTTWVIISWVLVAVLTAINVFVFLKLRSASQQIMKMAFPGAGNMSGGKNFDQQLQQAMHMLKNMQQKKR